ncbi:MAG: chemotaxis protein CheX [Spirochaetes bacterium]|nr:chemotaxis protein CheX [Spirochaetota bacterium]
MEKFDRNKLVDIFSKQTEILLSEIISSDVKLESIELKINPANINGYVAILNIIEDVKGTIICNFDEESAKKITQIMNSVSIDEIESQQEKDELIEASIGEVANMVGGKAITDFANFGFKCNITTPTIMRGENLKIFGKSQIVYILTYYYDFHKIIVLIGLQKN